MCFIILNTGILARLIFQKAIKNTQRRDYLGVDAKAINEKQY